MSVIKRYFSKIKPSIIVSFANFRAQTITYQSNYIKTRGISLSLSPTCWILSFVACVAPSPLWNTRSGTRIQFNRALSSLNEYCAQNRPRNLEITRWFLKTDFWTVFWHLSILDVLKQKWWMDIRVFCCLFRFKQTFQIFKSNRKQFK